MGGQAGMVGSRGDGGAGEDRRIRGEREGRRAGSSWGDWVPFSLQPVGTSTRAPDGRERAEAHL